MNFLRNILRENCKEVSIEAYDKYKNMPKEERKFEYAYLEASLKITPIFSILFSIMIFMSNTICSDYPNLLNLFVIIICILLIVTIIAIVETSYRMDALKEVDKDDKSNYRSKARRYGIS